MTNQLRAFNGDPSLKANLVVQRAEDVRTGRLVRGYEWQNGKGCDVSCLLRGSDYRKIENLGMPEWWGNLASTIFEGVPEGAQTRFAVDWLNAMPVGFEDWKRLHLAVITASAGADADPLFMAARATIWSRNASDAALCVRTGARGERAQAAAIADIAVVVVAFLLIAGAQPEKKYHETQ